MKFKVGDRVRIKSLDWYNENKDKYGTIYTSNGFCFCDDMTKHCGDIMKIIDIIVDPKDSNQGYYIMDNVKKWTDEMIEGLVEEETKPNIIEEAKTYWDSIKDAWICPEGYIFKDENGNVINATKIVLEKKKKEYPKTYEECCEIIHSDPNFYVDTHLYSGILETLYKLLICRDAYWKIAGEEMGLGKPWEPDWNDDDTVKYCIIVDSGIISKQNFRNYQFILAFPTEEMRDAFYENFKELIESVKELL